MISSQESGSEIKDQHDLADEALLHNFVDRKRLKSFIRSGQAGLCRWFAQLMYLLLVLAEHFAYTSLAPRRVMLYHVSVANILATVCT